MSKKYLTMIVKVKVVTICKSKVTLMLSKPAYVRMCILDLSKVLMYEFHYDCIKNSLLYEIKTDVFEDFSQDKEMLDFNNYSSAKSKYYDDSKKLVVGKIKFETIDVVIETFVGLKPKMFLFKVGNSSEHKKQRV